MVNASGTDRRDESDGDMTEHYNTKNKVTFSYFAPEAHSVQVAGDFTDWEHAPVELRKSRNGLWKKAVSLAPGRHVYRLLVDGEWCDDPECTLHQPNSLGGENCVCVVDGE